MLTRTDRVVLQLPRRRAFMGLQQPQLPDVRAAVPIRVNLPYPPTSQHRRTYFTPILADHSRSRSCCGCTIGLGRGV